MEKKVYTLEEQLDFALDMRRISESAKKHINYTLDKEIAYYSKRIKDLSENIAKEKVEKKES